MTTFAAVARRGGGWLALLAVTSVADVVAALALPAVLGRSVDAIIAGEGSGRWLAVAAGLIALSVATELIDAFAGPACVAGTTAWLRNRVVRHVLATGPEGFRRWQSGDLVARVSGNAAEAARAGPSIVNVATVALTPVGSLAALALIDPWIALAFLAGIALVALVVRAFARRTADVVTDYQRTQGRIAARLAESLAGARTIAAAGTVDQEERRVLEPLPELREQGVRTWTVLARSTAQAALVGPLALVAVLTVAGVELVHGRISAGEFFAASQYAVLGVGLGGLTGAVAGLARSRAGMRRLAEVLTVDPVLYGERRLPAGPGRLEFRGVTVREGEATLLENVDLALPGGAGVAVVGRSGAGKSLLAALAARLRDPNAGRVLLDGVPLDELTRGALRTAVGCAFERPMLVGRTVADAIGLGADRENVEAAARATHAHDFVTRLPHRYDTPLADAPMSGGEAQRLGLARAWHAERLLVLDDATSSLDMVTEMQIARTLTAEAGRTRLIVTHRAATAARADLVVWLEDGRVRAVGRHAELWADPAYREAFG